MRADSPGHQAPVYVYIPRAKSFVVNYRAGSGGRKALNKRLVVGRAGR